MKKITVFMMMIVLAFSLVGCGGFSEGLEAGMNDAMNGKPAEESTKEETDAPDEAEKPEEPVQGETTEQETPEAETEVQEETKADPEPTAEQEIEEATTESETEEQPEVSNDGFLEEVKALVEGQVGDGEAITDVKLENMNLCVYVDFSNADPAPFTMEELAISRVSSITDSILKLPEYDALWETITVDFGVIGKTQNGKDDIVENEYGRYFPSDSIVLK